MPRQNGELVRVAGFFQPGHDVNYITLNMQAGQGAFPVVFHEFSHLLLRGVFADAPLWFNEGLAEYYSTLEVTSGGRRANIGRPHPRHIGLLRERRLPFSEFFAIDRHSRAYTADVVEREILYAQAWAIVHHAFHGPANRRDQLMKFVTRLGSGATTETSFREAYGITPRELEREIQLYVLNQVYQYGSYEFSDSVVTRISPDVTAISDAEADAWLADLLAHMDRLDEAASRAKAALAAKPDSDLAHAVLGMFHLRGGRTSEGMDHLQRAVALGTANERVQLVYAEELLRSGARDNETMTRASRALERAIALRPGYNEAKVQLAYTYLATGKYAAARELLTPVVRANRTDHRAALQLAEALLRLNDFTGARELLGPVAARSTSDAERAHARDLLAVSAGLQVRSNTLEAAGLPVAGTPGETAPAAAPPARLIPTFRQLESGEQRVYGIFEEVECMNDGVALLVRTANAVLRARTASLTDVDFITYRQTAPSSVGCGKLASPAEVYLTWRISPDANAPTEGAAVAIELLPEGFVP